MYWKHVDKRGPNECWNWTGARYGTNSAYGQFSIDKVRTGAHRASWILHNGPVAEGLDVCHTCDNPLCVNPAHLWLGTAKDNMHDKINKGRHNMRKGEDVHTAKLTEADVYKVWELRDKGLSMNTLAKRFGVSQHAILKICNGKSWRHLPRPQKLF